MTDPQEINRLNQNLEIQSQLAKWNSQTQVTTFQVVQNQKCAQQDLLINLTRSNSTPILSRIQPN